MCTEKYTLRKVLQVKAEVDALLQTSSRTLSSAKALSYLNQLNSTKMTWGVLKQTRIAFSVNDLRKACSNVNVKRIGKRLLRNWRQLEPEVEPPSTPTGMKDTKDGGATGESESTTSHSSQLQPSSTRALDFSTTANVPADSSVSEEEKNEVGWSVRSGNVGLRLIFARNKPDCNKQTELNREVEPKIRKRVSRLVSR